MSMDIVIPNFNGRKFLGVCLDSIRRQSWTDFNVFVVDNGSSDGSVDFLRVHYPEVTVISWNENLGFSKAVNEGIAAGKAPLVFLLNNDTELEENCLQNLVSASREKTDFDFFAAKMVNFNERHLLDGAGEGFLRGGVGYRLGTMEPDCEVYNTGRQVFGACAGAALYRREFFMSAGAFDNDFFAYLEDVDLNLRANSRGRRCWYVPEALVYHIGSATTGGKINPFTVKLSTRNNLCVLVKNYPLSLLVRFCISILAYQLIWFCFVIKKKQFGAYCRGLFSFATLLPLMLAKRKKTLKMMTINSSDLAVLMKKAENEVVDSIVRRRELEGKGNKLFSYYKRMFL